MAVKPNTFDVSRDPDEMQADLDSIEIPPGVDQRLLTLWLQRERDAIDRTRKKNEPPPPKPYGRSLARLFPAYIGISVMCLTIVLGLVQRHETQAVLQTACAVFLVYTVIGAFAGMYAERFVNDSVETLLRDYVKRSRETGEEQGH